MRDVGRDMAKHNRSRAHADGAGSKHVLPLPVFQIFRANQPAEANPTGKAHADTHGEQAAVRIPGHGLHSRTAFDSTAHDVGNRSNQ